MKAKEIQKAFRKLGDAKIAEHSQGFFKTGKGEYGEGDKFLGIRVPVLRKQVSKFKDVSIDELEELLKSKYHEERLWALLALVKKFSKADDKTRKVIYKLYLKNTKHINNWDLVDSSAGQIVGAYLEDKDRGVLYKLAVSKDLWERRIAVISTFHMIRNNDFKDALKISAVLRDDREDLIHKAVGWMLREIGNRDLEVEKKFLKKHYKKMPRTMLRYAIEKFPKEERRQYLEGNI